MAKIKSRTKAEPRDEPWDPLDTCEVSPAALIEAVKSEGIYTYDLETTGLSPRNDRIEGVAFYVPNEKDHTRKPIRAWFPFTEATMDHSVGGTVTPLREPMPQIETMEKLRPIWQLPNVIAVRHNGGFDDAFLYLASGLDEPLEVNNIIADSMLADYIADERRKRYGLKLRVEQVFNHKMTTYNEAVGGQSVFGFANKKPLGVYACLDSQSLVVLADGSTRKISDIVKNREPVEVLSWNRETNQIEAKRVVEWHKNRGPKGQQWVRIITQRPTSHRSTGQGATFTPDHLVWTQRGWVEAGDIVSGDIVMTSERRLSYAQRQLVLGSCLGDGHTESRNNRRAAFIAGHSAKQQDYLGFKKTILGDLFVRDDYEPPKKKVISGREVESSGFFRITSHYHEEIAGCRSMMLDVQSGKKLPTPQWLREVDELGLAFFYFDNGALATSPSGSYSARINTHSFGKEGTELVAEWLRQRFELECVVDHDSRREELGYTIRFNDQASRALFELIYEFAPLSVQYKLGEAWRGRFRPAAVGTINTNQPMFDTVVDVVPYDHKAHGNQPRRDRYCISVEGNNNFFTPTGLVHNCDDCAWTYRLFRWAIDQIRLQDPPQKHSDDWCSPLDDTPGVYSDLEKIFWKIEMRIQKILMEMELTGCFIDWEWLVTVQERVQRQQQEILDEFKQTVGWVPNLRSPKQVSDFLYKSPEKGGLGVPTKGVDYNEDLDQYATGDQALKHRKEAFPLVSKLLKYRSLSVIDSSFCQKLIKLSQEEGRVYARFRQTGTVISRISSADPVNLMNQPRDKDLIRKAFCAHLENDPDLARSELCLIDADYGQMELRMAAHLAGEANMIEVYKNIDGCHIGPDGGPCERFTWYECFQCHKKAPPVDTPDGPRCASCGAHGSDIEHQKRCRHVDLHQRTSEDVGVPRNPLAKCLDGDTLVLGSPGSTSSIRPWSIAQLIGDVEPGDHRDLPQRVVLQRGTGQWGIADSAIRRHKRPTKIVITRRAVVVATDDHRFQVIGDIVDGLDPGTPGYEHVLGMSLVEACKLEKGMKIPVADMAHEFASESQESDAWHRSASPGELCINPFTKEVDPDGPAVIHLTENWAYFAGIFAGDGCASGNACTITHGSSEDYADWRQVVRGACDAVGLPNRTTQNKKHTNIGSRVVRRYFEGLGLAKEAGVTGAKIMRVPNWVLSGGPRMMWQYLAGLFDTDGTVGGEKAGTVSVTSKYPEFVGQVAFMLRWLGMPVSIQPGWNKTYERWYYTLHVLAEGFERFLKYCPMRYQEKVEKLRARDANVKRRCAPTHDEVLLVLDGGQRTVYDFQIDTPDHLYLQGGLIGHNNMNFGNLYRIGAPKFCSYANLFDEEGGLRLEYGQQLIDGWHAAYPGIATWHARVIRQVPIDNYVVYNIARRRRRLDVEWKRNDYRAGTQAIQFKVSSSCQELIKLAMIKLYDYRNNKVANSPPAEAALWAKLKFLIQIHDELLLEGPKAIKEELCALVKHCMESVATGMRVPFVADARSARNWDETH